jgi:hypothetical protein
MSSAALEERAQDRLQAQRAMDFALFNIPRILVMMPEQRKHGCSRPFRRLWQDINPKRKEKKIQLKGFAISDWKKCAD